MKNVHSEKGFQVYVGYYKMAWPFSELLLYKDRLQLNVWPIKYILNYSNIDAITMARNPWFPFVKIFKIIHNDNHIPKDIYYWGFNKEKLREELVKRNVTVR